MRRATLEVAQLAVERLRLRDVQRGPDQVLPADRGARDAEHQRHQVFRVHDADEIVRRAVVHGQARVLALVERLAHLFGGGGDVDGDHVEPRGHHLVHRGVGEGEDTEQHVALGGAEVGFERAWRRHEGVQALVHTAEQPQQRSERRKGAPRQRQGLGGELRRKGGEGARRGIAHHEQQRGGDGEGGEPVEPGALPPAQQIGGRHGAEHEQRQAREVQRPVQRHAPRDTRRRRVAQRVQGLAHRGLFAQRQQAGPYGGSKRHGKPYPQQRRRGLHHGAPLRSRLT